MENKTVAREGGSVAGKARRDLELKSGKKVSTDKNYLPKEKNKKGEEVQIKNIFRKQK
jgi:DNA-damage-inducible protein D